MNTKKNSLNNFFSCLSYRGNENTLSDIIAAACNSILIFKKLFLTFIFSDDSIMTKCPSEIKREVSENKGKSRFDLYFNTANGEQYVIENKINDLNDHFKEYSKFFFKIQFGFIANYNVSNIQYENKHTWYDFVKYLNKNLSLFSKYEKLLAEGVKSYIQGVCGIMEERNFYLKNLSDLGYFMQKLKELLTNKQFTFDNQPKGSNDNYIGYCVSKNKLKYWFGLYFSINKNDSFSLWGEIQNYELKSKINLKYSEYYPEPNDKGNKWFVLKKDFLSVLSSPSGYDDKIKLLEDFITEIENIR